MQKPIIRKDLISKPTNFQHVLHVEPEEIDNSEQLRNELGAKKCSSLGDLITDNRKKSIRKKTEAEEILDSILQVEAPSITADHEMYSLTPLGEFSKPNPSRPTSLNENSNSITEPIVVTRPLSLLISYPTNFTHVEHAETATEFIGLVQARESASKAFVSNAVERIKKRSIVSGFFSYNDLDKVRDQESEKNSKFQAIKSATSGKRRLVRSFLNQLFKKAAGRVDRRAELDTQLSNVESELEKKKVKEKWLLLEAEKIQKQREKISIKDFEILQTLGHGGFGIVRLVRDKVTGEVLAMKSLKKEDMIKRGQEGNVRAERDLLLQASQVADWIVQLYCTFQDEERLYFILEYMPGGDLLGLLIKLDIFPEDFAKHYCAEMVLAIEEVHKLGMIHRDIKPDNFLFDSQGHLKLADFGLATDLNNTNIQENKLGNFKDKRESLRVRSRKETAYSIVGTANYIAPEVLIGGGYNKSCDWWSLGVILFESVFGYPPFSAKSQQQTTQKILNWKKTLVFPSEPEVSNDCIHLIRNLICDADKRLGSKILEFPDFQEDTKMEVVKRMLAEGDAEDIKSHPWFSDIDWNTLHSKKPPFVPDPRRTYFDQLDEVEIDRMHQEAAEEYEKVELDNIEERKRNAFMGFSYQVPNGYALKPNTN